MFRGRENTHPKDMGTQVPGLPLLLSEGQLVSSPAGPHLPQALEQLPSPYSGCPQRRVAGAFFKTSPTSLDSHRSPECPMLNTCSACCGLLKRKEEGLWSSGGWRDLQDGHHKALGHGWVERIRAESSPAWESG